MKQYPSINNYKQFSNRDCVAFDKLDGSNIRFEYSRKRGWYKAGTRKCMLDSTHPHLGEAPAIFLNKYGEALEEVFRNTKDYKKHTQFMAFCEFLGPNSFAGIHQPDDPKDIILFDIWIIKKGLVGPKEFVKNFGHLDIPRVVYEGNINTEFVQAVKRNDYDLDEGVICKWGKTGQWKRDVHMCKIKTDAYISKLKSTFGVGKYTDSSGDSHGTEDDAE